jgi:uncharacterized RDD family membrane protein YckC
MTVLESSLVEIRTGEGVTFTLPLAGPASRFLALSVDVGVVTAVILCVQSLIGLIPAVPADVKTAVLVIGWFVLNIGYAIALEWAWGGATIGKKLLGIRVADARGFRLTFSQVLIRNLLRPVDSLPVFYLAGGAVMLCGPRMQRLGDIAADTIVLRNTGEPLAALPGNEGRRINSMASHRALAARLRQKADPVASRVALDALRRRDSMESGARVRLFGELAAGFRSLVEFPEESTLHLTDEQYLWNVVEIIYGNGSPVRQPQLELPVKIA